MNIPFDLELVFLPGLDGSGISFEPLSKELPSDLHTTVVTYPGTTNHTWEDLVHSAKSQLPLEKPLVLLAESFSGPITIKLLSESEVNVAGVIFCATFAKSPRPYVLHILKFLPCALLFRMRFSESMPDSVFGGKEYAAVLRPLFKRIKHEVPAEVVAHRTNMLADFNFAAGLSRITVPCCYIQATKDALVPKKNLLPFQSALSDLDVKRIEGPHYILQTKPKECAGVILDFIKRLIPV